jgi:pimeloyl-ACP methyl ester carboxylesterase
LEWEGTNPYTQESNIAILLGLMDVFSVDKAILVGNSAGGTLATAFALAHPNRVQALIEVDAAVYQTMPDSAVLEWLLKTPQMDHIGPLIARSLAGTRGDRFISSAWYDQGRLENNPEIIKGYRKPLTAENWDRALWEHTKATKPPDLAGALDQITTPTLVITGDSDQIVPVENSRQLARDIQGAVLAVLPNCGHLPQEECPQAFLQAIDQFIDENLEVNNE